MSARDDREFDEVKFPDVAARLHESILPVSDAELTDEQFICGVALALRAKWEGDDLFGTLVRNPVTGELDLEPAADWSEYREESIAAIFAFLEMLDHRGYRIVRKAN